MTANANVEIVRKAFDAFGRADVDALGDLYTDDYVIEFPYAKPEPGRVEGLSTVQDYLRVAFQTFRFTLTITDVYEVEPDFLIAEYTSSGEIVPTGKPYANSYVGLWRFRDGRASFTREYYDPMAAL